MSKQTLKKKIILEKEATTIRKEWGYGSTDPIPLKSLLLKLGVLSLFRPLSRNFSGMAIRVGEAGKRHHFMLINSEKSLGHQHFTICHELYHLYVQKAFESRICSTGKFNKRDPEEYNADYFAAYFLLPEDGIIDVIPNSELINGEIPLRTLLKIENIYGCSRKALLVRLKDLKLISDVQFQMYDRNVISSATSYGYPPYLYKASPSDSVVGNYGELAHELYDRELISESHFYNLMASLGFSIEDIEFQENDAI